MTDEAVMPDGRTLLAWRTEIDMLRETQTVSQERLKEAHHLARLAGIANVFREKNPRALEILIRVQLHTSFNSDDILDSAEILTPTP